MEHEKEKALAKVLILQTKLVKEANTTRGETKKTTREYAKALAKFCDMVDMNPEVVDDLVL